MKNQVAAQAKFSKLERKLNGYIFMIVLVQLIICSTAALLNCVIEAVA